MESPGAKLKKIRLEKGITLEEVQRNTKIQLNILKAIEGDSFTDMSPVYLKGFLKIYCRFLGQDYNEFISEYKNLQSQTKPEIKSKQMPQEEKKQPSFLKSASLRLSTIGSSNRIKVAIKIILVGIILWIGLFNLGKFISSRGKIKLAEVKEVAIKPSAKKQVSAESNKQMTPKAQTASGINLGIRARQNCWLLVKADGRVVFQRVLEKGRYESWQANKEIELSLGNAGGVELEVNGELFTTLGERGQVLKNILITKEGLKIDK